LECPRSDIVALRHFRDAREMPMLQGYNLNPTSAALCRVRRFY
jgi:hypothetical protein